MLKKKNLQFLGMILLFSIFTVIHGQESCCLNNKIKIQGLGENRIKPNLAILKVSIKTQDANITNVLTKLDTILDNITTSIQFNGLFHNDMRTTKLNVYPKYASNSSSKMVIGYKISLELLITIRGIQQDNKKIVKIVDSLIKNDAIQVNGVTYDTQDPIQGESQARNMAYENAIKKAKQYEQLSGRKLGKAVIFKQTLSSYSPVYNTTQIIPQVEQLPSNTTSSQIAFGNFDPLDMKVPEFPIGTIIINAAVDISWQLI